MRSSCLTSFDTGGFKRYMTSPAAMMFSVQRTTETKRLVDAPPMVFDVRPMYTLVYSTCLVVKGNVVDSYYMLKVWCNVLEAARGGG